MSATLPATRAAIVEGGMLGVSLGAALLEAGVPVTLIEEDAGAVERALLALDKLIARRVAAGEISTADGSRHRAQSRVAADPGVVADADLLIAPAGWLRGSEHAAGLRVVLDGPEGLAGLPRADRTVAMSFAVPVTGTHVVEVAFGAAQPRARVQAEALIGRMGLQAIVSDVALGPRLAEALREVADTLLIDATTPWELDEVMTDFGFASGVYEAQDCEGLDVSYARRKAQPRDPARRHIPLLDRMVHEGRLGRKVGVGWYRYPGGGGLVVDPLIEDMITEEAWFAKVHRAPLKDAEILERLLLGLINAAADLLHRGLARQASDIDLLSIHALGFPRARGGILAYADTLGAAQTAARLEELCAEDPVLWRPSPLILTLAEAKGRFIPA